MLSVRQYSLLVQLVCESFFTEIWGKDVRDILFSKVQDTSKGHYGYGTISIVSSIKFSPCTVYRMFIIS